MLENLKLLLGIEDATQDSLLELILSITEQKVLAYTRQETIPVVAQKLVAEMAADAYYLMRQERGEGVGEITGTIASISDNGQSVSYRDSAYASVLKTVSDDFLKGYTRFLERYRIVGW